MATHCFITESVGTGRTLTGVHLFYVSLGIGPDVRTFYIP